MNASLKSILFATLVASAPVAALAGTDDVGGFQSGRDIAAQAATGQPTPMIIVPQYAGTDASGGFQGTRDIGMHKHTMAMMATQAERFARGEDASGFQSAADINKAAGRI